ncbi:hypothetical protein PAEPH01_0927 [Pancytospora epiphaga]|nr:hypothetical protein PAEPH01_0927 [Pancytospora epiphaga]
MIFRKQIRIGLKVLFILLQTFLLLSGLAVLIFVFTMYFRLQELVNIEMKVLVPITACSCLSILNGGLSYIGLPSKKKIHFFFFTLSLAALLNIEIILAMMSSRLVDKGGPWINENWSNFSQFQRTFVEKQFECCGLETVTDRPGNNCKFTSNCMAKFVPIMKALRSLVQKSLMVLFFLETLSLCILSFLKFGK